MKRFVSALLSVGMILALAVPTFAVVPADRIDPNYTPEHYVGTISDDEMAVMLANSDDPTTGKATMPYNPGSGDTGLIMFKFKAKSDTMNWVIDWNNADAEDTYHFRLWRSNGEGPDLTPVEPAREASFGAGQRSIASASVPCVRGKMYLPLSLTGPHSGSHPRRLSNEAKKELHTPYHHFGNCLRRIK